MNILNYFAITALEIGIPEIDANTLLNNGLNLFYIITGAVAVLIIIIAGFMYATSNGNPDTIKKAKNAILYAVIGLIVILLAFTITQFVIGRFV